MGFVSSLPNQMGDAQGMQPAELDNFAPGSNYRSAPGQRPGVEMGSPGGQMPPQNLADIGQQTQQMANNPVYGQASPFQPPQQPIGGNFFDALSKSLGMPQTVQGQSPAVLNPGDVGSGGGGGKGGFDPRKLQGTGGPAIIWSPPQAQSLPPMMDSVGGMMGGKMGMIADASAKAQNRGQLVGGSVNKPIVRGGLRPAPRNYRPPRGNLRSFTRR